MPPGFCVSLVAQLVATTTLRLLGANFTSDIWNAGMPSRWVQLAPLSVVLNKPPLSVAAIAVAAVVGSTSTAMVRPPHLP
jgi:hypothetical protein